MRIQVSVATNNVGSRVSKIMEVDEDQWKRMNEEQRSDWVFEFADQNMMFEVDYEEL